VGIWICRRSERVRSKQVLTFTSKADIRLIQFTKPENAPLKARLIWHLQRHISWLFEFTLPCRYIRHRRQSLLEHGYLVMDYVDDAGVEMLSETWNQYRHHQD
jgi:hypothetical protein